MPPPPNPTVELFSQQLSLDNFQNHVDSNISNKLSFDNSVLTKIISTIKNKLILRKFSDVGILGRTFQNCFIATDLIDLLVRFNFATSSESALDIGQKLLSLKIIQPVLSNVNQKFENKKDIYILN